MISRSKNGDTYRQLAAKQQLLDTTIKATRGEIHDTSGITLASTSVVWTIWADPDNSKFRHTTTGKRDEEAARTLDTAMCAEVSRELTLRLLRCTFQDGHQVSGAGHQGEQRCQAVHRILRFPVQQGTQSVPLRPPQGQHLGRQREELPAQLPLRSVWRQCWATDADGIGTYGLEKSYQSTLAGVDGRTITQRNAYGNAIADENATTFAAKDGSNLVLSLDVNVQEIVNGI